MNVVLKTISEEINPYLKHILSTKNGRYLSWEHCYNAFGDNSLDEDTLALHLGFYLASWGMYRGSTTLLQRDYKIHIPIVKILKNFPELRCEINSEPNRDSIPKILELKSEIIKEYKEFKPTDTLITKIILGTLGCVPAIDRYFCDGMRSQNLKNFSLTERFLNTLFDFVEEYEGQITDAQLKLKIQKVYYPRMKIVDMYFWQLGFNMEKETKKN